MRMRIAGPALLLAAGFVALMFWREQLPVVRMADGTELHVLKRSAGKRHYFSDETGWRRFAIDSAPQKYLPRIGLARNEFERPHGALVLWVTKFNPERSAPIPPRINAAEVEFSDKRRAAGRLSLITSNVLQIEFPVYPRADREFTVRLVEKAQQASFAFKNPLPVKLAQWAAGSLPQTNVSANAIVTLAGDEKSGLSLRLRDPKEESVGWTQWRVEVEDTAGNYEQFVVNHPRLRELRDRVYQRGPLKLTVQAREYLSAGFVTNRAAGVIQEMEANERATNLRFSKLFFLGPATDYLFTNGVPSVHMGAPLGTNEFMRTTNSAQRWDVHLAVGRKANLVAIYRESTRVESFEARLRERSRQGDGGTIFNSFRRPNEARSMPPARLLRQFEAPMFYSTNAIEAEIIARHRPVEFVIQQNE
jgi:hypothetical protein